MTTFIKKKLKDREGNYLVTPSSADIVYCSDGETVATKLRKVENDEFSPTITQMSSVSKVGVGEDIDISDNTQEGYLKSAILSGNTLVNLATHSKRQTINVQNLSELNGRLTWNTTGSWGKVGFTIQGKPNTNYCIKYDDRHETLGIYVRFLDGLSGTTQSTTRLSPTCVKFTTDTTGIFTLTLEQGSATTGSWIQSPMIIEYAKKVWKTGIFHTSLA